MVKMNNELQIIEAKISKSLNDERKSEENEVIEEIKENPKKFYKYAKKFSKTHEAIGPLLDKNENIITNNEKWLIYWPHNINLYSHNLRSHMKTSLIWIIK